MVATDGSAPITRDEAAAALDAADDSARLHPIGCMELSGQRERK